jgi:hypothetical protein
LVSLHKVRDRQREASSLINLDQVLTVESAHTTSGTHTLIKFANERAETVSEPPSVASEEAPRGKALRK